MCWDGRLLCSGAPSLNGGAGGLALKRGPPRRGAQTGSAGGTGVVQWTIGRVIIRTVFRYSLTSQPPRAKGGKFSRSAKGSKRRDMRHGVTSELAPPALGPVLASRGGKTQHRSAPTVFGVRNLGLSLGSGVRGSIPLHRKGAAPFSKQRGVPRPDYRTKRSPAGFHRPQPVLLPPQLGRNASAVERPDCSKSRSSATTKTLNPRLLVAETGRQLQLLQDPPYGVDRLSGDHSRGGTPFFFGWPTHSSGALPKVQGPASRYSGPAPTLAWCLRLETLEGGTWKVAVVLGSGTRLQNVPPRRSTCTVSGSPTNDDERHCSGWRGLSGVLITATVFISW